MSCALRVQRKAGTKSRSSERIQQQGFRASADEIASHLSDVTTEILVSQFVHSKDKICYFCEDELSSSTSLGCKVYLFSFDCVFGTKTKKR